MNPAAIVAFLGAAFGISLALIHILKRRRAFVDFAFAAGSAALAVEALYSGLTDFAGSQSDLAGLERHRLVAVSFVPEIWLLFSVIYARGGAIDSFKRWRWLSIGSLLLVPGFAGIFREHLVLFAQLDPSSSRWTMNLGWAGIVVYVLLLICSVLVVVNLEATYRAAVGTMRWRIKFMLLGVGLLFIVRIYTSSQALLFRGIETKMETLNSATLIVAALLIMRSFFRTQRFEIDVYPSQSVLQNSITILLAGVYLVVVGILAKVAAYLGGDSRFALKALLALVSLVVLAVILQSDRARLHLGRFVSRNFQRPLHDYRTVWRKFTEGTTSQVEQDGLCRSLVGLMAEVFQSLSVAIWLLDDKRESFSLAASTFLPAGHGQAFELKNATTSELISRFRDHSEPVDIEAIDKSWAASLREIHPSQFPNGGHRVCVPLISQGDVIGIFTIGDRVGGVDFTLQDFDMLKCVADHATAGLRNVQLSQKLLQAKELEAFQTMAAFFVHDLKNAASTLNLMLQNLPVHFDDPAFREDSLRGIAKTVKHINRLIGRLGLLRHEQRIQASEADLNEVVAAALAGLEQGAGPMLSKALRPLSKVMLDREQISKVVTNLVLNATEAVAPENGRIQIETWMEARWVVISVEDNGCGMSVEFLAKGLFRPFRTTKKSGLGIGMFQSKMIVEAHGGRITVASEPGRGTTFQVFLPVSRPY